MGLGGALMAFAMSVEVAGLRCGGQLPTELERVRGGEGWRLSFVRLVEEGWVLGARQSVWCRKPEGQRGMARSRGYMYGCVCGGVIVFHPASATIVGWTVWLGC